MTQHCLKTTVSLWAWGTALHKMLLLQQLRPPNPALKAPGSGPLFPWGCGIGGELGVETAVASMGLANTQLMRPASSEPPRRGATAACCVPVYLCICQQPGLLLLAFHYS